MSYQSITAKILIDIKAINFNFDNPYTLTSGKKSPVYVDCRKIISFTKERNQIISFIESYFIENNIEFDLLAGGETAGIPYAAFLAERLNKPMIYIRKKPKKLGKRSQIEGDFKKNSRVILIEDLSTDGESKINFCKAITKAGGKIKDIFVIFDYGVYSDKVFKRNRLNLYYLTNWKSVIKYIKTKKILKKSEIIAIESFLSNTSK